MNFEPPGGPGGLNYGWDYREGTLQGPSATPQPPIAFVDPISEYPRDFGQSITGGYVYRGPAPGLQGAYFFADFVTGRLITLRMVNGVAEDAIERTAQVGADLSQLSSFGTDNGGNLYAVTLSGTIYRLDPGISSGDGADSIDGGADNDNLSGGIGNDTLNGGTGTDTMLGGAGSDVYVIDNAGDIVDESIAGSNGNDHVQSSISFSLANGQGQCRTLVLLGAANVDTIAAFSVPDVTIQLENAIFTALDVGTLAASALPHRCWRRRRARPHHLQQRHRRADLRQQRQCCRRRHPVRNPFNRPCHDKLRFLRGMRAASGDSCRIIRVDWSNA